MIGSYIFSLAVIVNNCKVLIMSKTHYGFTLILNLGSTVLYFLFFYSISSNK